jgi:hypothetical protein
LHNHQDKGNLKVMGLQDNLLWACLAASAIAARELNCAEMAYAALDEVFEISELDQQEGPFRAKPSG